MKILDGIVSLSEQRRLLQQLIKLSNEELRAKAANETLHPGVRSVAQFIVDTRLRSLAEHDTHAGEQ